jgi:hypothetical protein
MAMSNAKMIGTSTKGNRELDPCSDTRAIAGRNNYNGHNKLKYT